MILHLVNRQLDLYFLQEQFWMKTLFQDKNAQVLLWIFFPSALEIPFGKYHNIHAWCLHCTCAFPYSKIYPVYEKVPSHPSRWEWEQKRRRLRVKCASSVFSWISKFLTVKQTLTIWGQYSVTGKKPKGQNWEPDKDFILPVISLFNYDLGDDGFCWHSFYLFLTFAYQFINNLIEVMI